MEEETKWYEYILVSIVIILILVGAYQISSWIYDYSVNSGPHEVVIDDRGPESPAKLSDLYRLRDNVDKMENILIKQKCEDELGGIYERKEREYIKNTLWEVRTTCTINGREYTQTGFL